ncbi:MAG: glycosyl hydrolase family 28-related protein, partial [Verrucomicrobiota bacterium JB024]|nr:glycosyl hydrolase family 28-related protein [Verrucomicrobiota bacterium JB024]
MPITLKMVFILVGLVCSLLIVAPHSYASETTLSAITDQATSASLPASPVIGEMTVFNVRDFGAKGDGKADDTAAIERAWAAVMDTSKPQ